MKMSARTALALLTAIIRAIAQETGGASATLGKVTLVFETRIDPPGAQAVAAAFGGHGVIVGMDAIHRYVSDQNTKRFIGYDATIREVTGSPGEYSLDLRPLSIGAERIGLPRPEAWTAWPPPAFHAPPRIRHNDKLEFTLMTSPATGQRLIERITVKTDGRPVTLRPLVPAREFKLEDVELEIADMDLTINGQPADLGGGGGGMRGSPIWLYLASRGRFVFSLSPRLDLGMRRAGEIRGEEMSFRIGGNAYLIKSSRQIAPGAGAYHLYVYHDPGWVPQQRENFILGAGGTLEGLTRR